MSEIIETMHYEIQRLRDLVARQYLEISWQETELRRRNDKAPVAKICPGELVKRGLRSNEAMLSEVAPMPSPASWPAGPEPAVPLVPNSGFANYGAGKKDTKVLGIFLCGVDEKRVEVVVAMIEDRLRKNPDFRPVFLTDTTRTEIFRRRGFTYEYFAPPAEMGRRSPTQAYKEFTRERHELIRRKWGMSGIINFGAMTEGMGADVQQPGPAYAGRSSRLPRRTAPKRRVRSVPPKRAT